MTKNKSLKSLASLCIRAKYDRQELIFSSDRKKNYWYVCLKGFGYTRSYKSFDYIHAALIKACAKYGVDYCYC